MLGKANCFPGPEQEGGERVRLCTGKVKLVAIDNKGDIARIPDDVAAYFLERVKQQTI